MTGDWFMLMTILSDEHVDESVTLNYESSWHPTYHPNKISLS